MLKNDMFDEWNEEFIIFNETSNINRKSFSPAGQFSFGYFALFVQRKVTENFLKFMLTNKSHRYIIHTTVEPQEAEM